MEKDYFNMSGFGMPPYYDYNMGTDPNTQNPMDNNMFNPIIQYEQAYMYYRYLTQQMDYKIKCKEYEKLSSNSENSRTSARKIE